MHMSNTCRSRTLNFLLWRPCHQLTLVIKIHFSSYVYLLVPLLPSVFQQLYIVAFLLVDCAHVTSLFAKNIFFFFEIFSYWCSCHQPSSPSLMPLPLAKFKILSHHCFLHQIVQFHKFSYFYNFSRYDRTSCTPNIVVSL